MLREKKRGQALHLTLTFHIFSARFNARITVGVLILHYLVAFREVRPFKIGSKV